MNDNLFLRHKQASINIGIDLLKVTSGPCASEQRNSKSINPTLCFKSILFMQMKCIYTARSLILKCHCGPFYNTHYQIRTNQFFVVLHQQTISGMRPPIQQQTPSTRSRDVIFTLRKKRNAKRLRHFIERSTIERIKMTKNRRDTRMTLVTL